MVSHEHQCIFVHIPKTAGNSINRVFSVGWEDHKDLQRYYDEMPREQFDRYFKFAVVRNPWDRLLSDYNYQRKKSREKDSKLFVFTEGGSKRNFAEWAELALENPDFYEARRWGGEVSQAIHRWSPQIDWISVEGKPRVDFVARIERLQEDFQVVCNRVGLPHARVPHRNRRLHWHYSRYYDQTTRDLVGRYYARDIEQFGYEFEKPLCRFSFAGARPSKSSSRVRATVAAPSTSRTNETVTIRPWWRRRESILAAGFVTVLALAGAARLAASTHFFHGVASHLH